MQSRGPPSNTTILVLALSSPAQTRQPTNSTSSPARKHQTRHRLSPCPLSHSPPHFPPPIPWLASDGMPATASLTQPSAPIAGDRIARQHSTAKALRMAKPLFPAHRLATRTAPEKWRLFVTPYLYSQTPFIHHPVVTCAWHATRRQTAIRREWKLVIVKALGDCHQALSSSGSSKAVHAAKHRGGHPAPCTMKQDTRQSPGLRVR